MSSNFLILTAVGIAFFSEAFLYGVAVPILPFMLHERAGFALGDLQWYCSFLLTAYSASSLAFAPVAGFVTDRTVSRKRPFLIALVLMLIVRAPRASTPFFRCSSLPASWDTWTTHFLIVR